MAPDSSAAVISFHQAPPKSRALTGAERAKAYRDRKRKGKLAQVESTTHSSPPVAHRDAEHASVTLPTLTSSGDAAVAAPTVARDHAPTVTPAPVTPPAVTSSVTASRFQFAPILLNGAALALAGVGVAINGWFARSLGSSETAGWLFLALGVAADLIALGMPSCAAGLWQARQRAASLVGWALWLSAFVFAVTAGLGFASTNVSDVTLARASRVTPAVAAAQAALSDAMTARDRECRGGVGKFCREREAVVAERRQVLDAAAGVVGLVADPQTDAATKLVAWASFGALRPTPEDFATLRLMLFALLPQVGGLLMVIVRLSGCTGCVT